MHWPQALGTLPILRWKTVPHNAIWTVSVVSRLLKSVRKYDVAQPTPFSGLNSFFQDFADKQVVLEKLDQKLRKLEPGVTLMVTHQVVITSVTGQAVGSGEFIAFNTRTKEARKFRLD